LKVDSYRIIVGNATDTGIVRSYNEDYMAHFDTPYGYCIIVCDGMGGHAAGDIASRAATEALKHYLQDGNLTKLETPNSLQNALEFANYKLRQMVRENPKLAGMGTTCVMALIYRSDLFIAHAGDSRIYLIRNNTIRQLTRDHSTIQNLIDSGIMTPEEAKHSNKKNQITKAIGIFDRVEPSVAKHALHLKHNDKILLCSDGLTTHVDQKEILKTVKAHVDAQDAALQLVEKANLLGGTDNITVQLIHYYGKSTVTLKEKIQIKRIVIASIIFLMVLALGYFVYQKIRPAMMQKNTETDLPVSLPANDSIPVQSE
jgi:PPM family protein phosphatase